MSAEVIAYSAGERDIALSLKVECLGCHSEWGWATDAKGIAQRLQAMADQHNGEHHKESP